MRSVRVRTQLRKLYALATQCKLSSLIITIGLLLAIPAIVLFSASLLPERTLREEREFPRGNGSKAT